MFSRMRTSALLRASAVAPALALALVNLAGCAPNAADPGNAVYQVRESVEQLQVTHAPPGGAAAQAPPPSAGLAVAGAAVRPPPARAPRRAPGTASIGARTGCAARQAAAPPVGPEGKDRKVKTGM